MWYTALQVNSGGSLSKGGRRRLRVAEGFGRAVYEGMVRQRTADGLVWGIPDLARATEAGLNTVRAWISGGTVPKGKTLAKLAKAIGETTDALLLYNELGIYPIYMSGGALKVAEPTVPAISADVAADADERANVSRNQEAREGDSPPQRQTQ